MARSAIPLPRGRNPGTAIAIAPNLATALGGVAVPDAFGIPSAGFGPGTPLADRRNPNDAFFGALASPARGGLPARPYAPFSIPIGGRPVTTLDWGQLALGGANIVGAYFDRKNQRKIQAQEYRRMVRRNLRGAAGPTLPGASSPLLNVNPNLGGTAVNSMAALGFGELPGLTADPFGGLASWQTAPIGGVDWSIDAGGGASVPVTQAQVPVAVGGAVVAAARALPALARSLARFMAPAAAVALAEMMIGDGHPTNVGPYRTSAGNRALAYAGDLAACKRLRKLGSAIGYARGTGARRSVRRGRRC